AIGAADRFDITRQRRFHAEALQRVANGADVGPAGIHQHHAHTSTPLVVGNASPSRRMAWRRQRATTLKHASTMWCALSPRTARCRLAPSVSHSERKKCG